MPAGLRSTPRLRNDPGADFGFDAVLFASGSAVDAFVNRHGATMLTGRDIVSIGPPTTAALARHGLLPTVTAWQATPAAAIDSLADANLQRRLAALG